MRRLGAVLAGGVLLLGLTGCVGEFRTAEQRHEDNMKSMQRTTELAQVCKEAGGFYTYSSWNGYKCEFTEDAKERQVDVEVNVG